MAADISREAGPLEAKDAMQVMPVPFTMCVHITSMVSDVTVQQGKGNQ